MRGSFVLCALALALPLMACGARQNQGTVYENVDDWDCRARTASYTLTGGFVAPETGIAVSCKGDDAKLESWRVDKNGKRTTSSHPLSQVEFEDLWKKIEDAGWRNLGDCDNPEAADDDPVYSIDVSDDSANVSLSCQGKELPFPYDRLVNELDLKAAGFTQ